MRHTIPFAALLLVMPQGGHAQLRELQSGARIRVTAPTVFGSRYEATIGARRGDTLSLVRPDAQPIDLPLDAATTIEISRGRSRWAGLRRGLLWGAGIGAALGIVNAFVPRSESDTYCYAGDCNRSDLEEGATLLAGSMMWGAGIGALVGRERWQQVRSPSGTGRGAGSGPARLRVGLRVAIR